MICQVRSLLPPAPPFLLVGTNKQNIFPHTCPHTCLQTSVHCSHIMPHTIPTVIPPPEQQAVSCDHVSTRGARPRTTSAACFPASLRSLAPPPTPQPHLQSVSSHHVSHQGRQASHHLCRCYAAQQLHQPCMVDAEQAIAYRLWYLGLGPHVSPLGREGVQEGEGRGGVGSAQGHGHCWETLF